MLFSLVELLRGNQPFSDVSLLCGDKRRLAAHAVIIKARCPQLLEPAGGEILAQFDSKVVSGLLHFLYSDVLAENVNEDAKALQALAAQLKLRRLEMLCEENIPSSV